jgi:uncharacterized protein YjbI with pentapeptide repeats
MLGHRYTPTPWVASSDDSLGFFKTAMIRVAAMTLQHYTEIELSFAEAPANNTTRIGSAVGSGLSKLIELGGAAAVVFLPIAPMIAPVIAKGAEAANSKLFQSLNPAKHIPANLTLAANRVSRDPSAIQAALQRLIERFADALSESFKPQLLQLNDSGRFVFAAVAIGRALYYVGENNKELTVENLMEGVYLGFSGRQWMSSHISKILHGQDFGNNRVETIQARPSHAWTVEGMITEPLISYNGELYYVGKKPKLDQAGMPKYGIRYAQGVEAALLAAKSQRYTPFPVSETFLQQLKDRFGYDKTAKTVIEVVNPDTLETYAKINRYYMSVLGISLPFKDFVVFHTMQIQNPEKKDGYMATFTACKTGNPISDLASYEQIIDAYQKHMLEHRDAANRFAITFKLSGDLKGRNLNQADFSHLNCQGVDFSGCALAMANFSHSVIINCQFTETVMPKVQMVAVAADGAKFTKAIMPHANITDGAFFEAEFHQADIRNLTHVHGKELDGALGIKEAITTFDLDAFVDAKNDKRDRLQYEADKAQAKYLFNHNEFLHALITYQECYAYLERTKAPTWEIVETINAIAWCHARMESWDLAEANFNLAMLKSAAAITTAASRHPSTPLQLQSSAGAAGAAILSPASTISTITDSADSPQTEPADFLLLLHQVVAQGGMALVSFDHAADMGHSTKDGLELKQLDGYFKSLEEASKAHELLLKAQQALAALPAEQREKHAKKLKNEAGFIEVRRGLACGKIAGFARENKAVFAEWMAKNPSSGYLALATAAKEEQTELLINAISHYTNGITIMLDVGQYSVATLCSCYNNICDLYEILGDDASPADRQSYYNQALNAIEHAIVHAEADRKEHGNKSSVKDKSLALYYYNKGAVLLKRALLLPESEERSTELQLAAEVLREASRLNNQHIATWHNRILVQKLMGNYAIAKDLADNARNDLRDDPRIMIDFAETCLQKIAIFYSDPTLALSSAQQAHKDSLLQKAKGALTVAIANLMDAIKAEHPIKEKAPWNTRTDLSLIHAQLVMAYALQGNQAALEKHLALTSLTIRWTLVYQLEQWRKLGLISGAASAEASGARGAAGMALLLSHAAASNASTAPGEATAASTL